ncbi:UNVERIFIED_CONTAM: hypothetical protein Sradi_2095900 [Sesamum radiatum]|uniref:Uncharacterized protein n=1 Tax=Sesamum radiatum TaxID=300843 RepID=A0AAW2TLR3_SESRA
MRENEERQKSRRYCNYHRDRGHETEECVHLQRELERLIQSGHLIEELYHSVKIPRTHEPIEGRTTSPPENWSSGRIIHLIEREGYGGNSRAARKRHLRELRSSVFMTTESDNRVREDITFSNEDTKRITFPHEEALVVSAIVSNTEVRRILINSGSSVDILFKETFRKMGMRREELMPRETILMGFEGSTIRALGEIILPVSLGEEPRIKTIMVRFLVVDTSYPSYNIILGRPALNAIGAVISTSCLKMKFPTEYEIGEVCGNQRSARECRCHALGKIQKDEGGHLNMEGKMNPVNAVKSISLDEAKREKFVQVGTNLSPEEEEELKSLLQNWEDVLEWEEGEIRGISEDIIRHELHVREGAKPVRQKKRNFGNERNQII